MAVGGCETKPASAAATRLVPEDPACPAGLLLCGSRSTSAAASIFFENGPGGHGRIGGGFGRLFIGIRLGAIAFGGLFLFGFRRLARNDIHDRAAGGDFFLAAGRRGTGILLE